MIQTNKNIVIVSRKLFSHDDNNIYNVGLSKLESLFDLNK